MVVIEIANKMISETFIYNRNTNFIGLVDFTRPIDRIGDNFVKLWYGNLL